VIIGWLKIYKARGELTTDGIYGHLRHPQYLGLMLITIGMLIQWPTILTLLMWPVLIVAYCRLARREEKELEGQFGQLYRDYKSRVKAFIPF
jgi:methanethiol S-methyltransferase